MPSDRPEYVVYGLTRDKPLAITLPPVEATSDQPLPDAGSFLRVCAGVEEPTTALLRITGQLVGMWRYVHEQRPRGKDSAQVDEQLNLAIWLIDQEAGGHTKEIVCAPKARTAPSSYGQWVAWLVWKYVLYALRQHDAEHHERDAAELSWCIGSFNQLVAEVRVGQLRLPKEATETEVFPPRMVGPEGNATSVDSPGDC